MPHCTTDFAWYLGKFIVGFAGMFFLYVGFLKEKEPLCLCPARSRESMRRKHEKRNDRCECGDGIRDDRYACGCRRKKPLMTRALPTEHGAGKRIAQVQRSDPNDQRSVTAIVPIKQINNKYQHVTQTDPVGDTFFHENRKVLESKRKRRRFCGHCHCCCYRRPVSRGKNIKKASFARVRVSHELLPRRSKINSLDTPNILQKELTKKEQSVQFSDFTTLTSYSQTRMNTTEFTEKQIENSPIKNVSVRMVENQVSEAKDICAECASSLTDVKIAQDICSNVEECIRQNRKGRAQKKEEDSPVIAKYDEETRGEEDLMEVYLVKEDSEDTKRRTFDEKTETNDSDVVAVYDEECYCCSYCQDSNLTTKYNRMVNDAGESFGEAYNGEQNNIRKKRQLELGSDSDKSLECLSDDYEICTNTSKQFKSPRIVRKRYPDSWRSRVRFPDGNVTTISGRDANVQRKLINRPGQAFDDPRVDYFSPKTSKTGSKIVIGNSTVCRDCLREEYLRSRAGRIFNAMKLPRESLRPAFGRSPGRSTSCPRNSRTAGKKFNVGRSQSYVHRRKAYVQGNSKPEVEQDFSYTSHPRRPTNRREIRVDHYQQKDPNWCICGNTKTISATNIRRNVIQSELVDRSGSSVDKTTSELVIRATGNHEMFSSLDDSTSEESHPSIATSCCCTGDEDYSTTKVKSTTNCFIGSAEDSDEWRSPVRSPLSASFNPKRDMNLRLQMPTVCVRNSNRHIDEENEEWEQNDDIIPAIRNRGSVNEGNKRKLATRDTWEIKRNPHCFEESQGHVPSSSESHCRFCTT